MSGSPGVFVNPQQVVIYSCVLLLARHMAAKPAPLLAANVAAAAVAGAALALGVSYAAAGAVGFDDWASNDAAKVMRVAHFAAAAVMDAHLRAYRHPLCRPPPFWAFRLLSPLASPCCASARPPGTSPPSSPPSCLRCPSAAPTAPLQASCGSCPSTCEPACCSASLGACSSSSITAANHCCPSTPGACMLAWPASLPLYLPCSSPPRRLAGWRAAGWPPRCTAAASWPGAAATLPAARLALMAGSQPPAVCPPHA